MNEKDPVKEIKVIKLLDQMLKDDRELYEKILDSKLSYSFNKIVRLAMSKHIQFNSPKATQS